MRKGSVVSTISGLTRRGGKIPRNLAQQLPTVHQLPVAILENRDLFHAKHSRRVPLLLVPRGGEISVRQGRVFRPLIPIRRDQIIVNLDPLPNEQRHRPPAPNLRIIRMRRNNQNPLQIPKLRNHHSHPSKASTPQPNPVTPTASYPPSFRRKPESIPAPPRNSRTPPPVIPANAGIPTSITQPNPHNANRAYPLSLWERARVRAPRPPLNSIARSYNPNTTSALAAHVSPRAASNAPSASRRRAVPHHPTVP